MMDGYCGWLQPTVKSQTVSSCLGVLKMDNLTEKPLITTLASRDVKLNISFQIQVEIWDENKNKQGQYYPPLKNEALVEMP